MMQIKLKFLNYYIDFSLYSKIYFSSKIDKLRGYCIIDFDQFIRSEILHSEGPTLSIPGGQPPDPRNLQKPGPLRGEQYKN